MPRKTKTLFYCRECGNESAQWFGRCPSCAAWNTMVEAPTERERSGAARAGSASRRFGASTGEPPRPLGETDADPTDRIRCGLDEFDRAIGGGIVPGVVILLGGDPGVGKSTLAMQAAGRLAAAGHAVLYVTGEESRRQVQLRARRIDGAFDAISLAAEADVGTIAEWVGEMRPTLVIVDSIQTALIPDVDGAPGSIAQVREAGLRLHGLAKSLGTAVIMIGHVTKDGSIAGPRLLEHMVDTVLYLEGERIGNYRVLRAVKNRFGSTDEIGIFEMREAGMVEVVDPSRLLVDSGSRRGDGSVVVPAIEGTRPILLEMQALVTPTAYGMAQRVATGFDPKRLAVLLAVLRKHVGIDLSGHDVFLNVVSGIRITEPAADLGMVAAMVSSYADRPVPEGTALFGEIGLGGEVRGVGQAERRVAEALRVGFDRVVVPHMVWKDLPERRQAQAVPVKRVNDALEVLGLLGSSSREEATDLGGFA